MRLKPLEDHLWKPKAIDVAGKGQWILLMSWLHGLWGKYNHSFKLLSLRFIVHSDGFNT